MVSKRETQVHSSSKPALIIAIPLKLSTPLSQPQFHLSTRLAPIQPSDLNINATSLGKVSVASTISMLPWNTENFHF